MVSNRFGRVTGNKDIFWPKQVLLLFLSALLNRRISMTTDLDLTPKRASWSVELVPFDCT